MPDQRDRRRLHRHGLRTLLDLPVTWFLDDTGTRHLDESCAKPYSGPLSAVRVPFPQRPAGTPCRHCNQPVCLSEQVKAARLVGSILREGAPVRLRTASWSSLSRACQQRARVVQAIERLERAPARIGNTTAVLRTPATRAELDRAVSRLRQHHTQLTSYITGSVDTIVTYAAAWTAAEGLRDDAQFDELLILGRAPGVASATYPELEVQDRCPALDRWQCSAQEGDPAEVRRRHWCACVAASGPAATARDRAVTSLVFLDRLEHRFTELQDSRRPALVSVFSGRPEACLEFLVAELFGVAAHDGRVLAVVPEVIAGLLSEFSFSETEYGRLPDHPDAVHLARTVWSDADGLINGAVLADATRALLN